MPEIGECYTIANKIPTLGKVTSVKKSARFNSYIAKTNKILQNLEGSNIGKPFAHGKSVWFPLVTKDGKSGFLISQLGMSGSWFLDTQGRDEKNDHLVIEGNGVKLRYSDPRMFGKMRLFLNETFEETLKHFKWGVDPLTVSPLNLAEVMAKWTKSSKKIKVLMLDQNVVFGIGNYLASEILYAAKISPHKLGKDLTKEDLLSLAKESQKIIKLAVKTGGYSFAGGYYHPDGTVGTMGPKIKIYDKERCPEGHLVVNENIAGRSTFICYKCQGKK